MRPIYNYQSNTNTAVLKNTVDGVTERVKLHGSDHYNALVEARQVAGDLKKGLSIDLVDEIIKDPTASDDWTLMFKVVSTSLPQDAGFNKGIVGIGTSLENMKSSHLQASVNLGPGDIHILPLQISNIIRNGVTTSHKFWFGVDTQDKSDILLEDVMLIKGNWSKPMPYFTGKKGVGPHVNLISHNKNLMSNYRKNNNLSVQSSGLGEQSNQRYIAYFIPVEPNTDYNFSFKRLISNDKNRFRVYQYANPNPKKGDKSIKTKDMGNVVTSGTFRTESNAKTIMVYLHYVATKIDLDFDKYVANVQLEAGDKATPYVEPGYDIEKITLPRELMTGETFEYDPEYKTYVIKDEKGNVKELSEIPNIWFKTYDGTTWTSVIDEHNLLAGMEFYYPTNPNEYIYKHAEVLIVLKSGKMFDTRQYKTIDKSKKGRIILKDGIECQPEVTIFTANISNIIHLD